MKKKNKTLSPTQVIPEELARVVEDLPYWFVIGGHAVRCFCPYRPSQDVDFGVHQPKNIKQLVSQFKKAGKVELLEQDKSTVHLRFNGLNVSIFMLKELTPFVKDRRLNTTAILATKLHAILDRGTRRDFFDLYIIMQHHRLGIAECLSAMSEVYQTPINKPLLLRALTFFEDAEREAALPGEGPEDWKTIKDFFISRVGQLLIPPGTPLKIQSKRIGITRTQNGSKK